MITYKKAGVDIEAGDELVDRIKKMAPKIGGFSDGMPLPKGYKKPILIGCTDGVGTKLALAQALDIHDTIGYDLVGMNVNDLICSGAKPLFFLDYYACGKLNVKVAETVVRGIVNACKESDCVLIGGETAEMPGFYKPNEYDLAGFATGVVDADKKLRPQQTLKAGDVLLGLPSSGPHSNGYSLIRKVFSKNEWRKYAKELLAPTRLYVRPILKAIKNVNTGGQWAIKGLVHVTGSGFTGNIPRILPSHLSAELYRGSWRIPEIFNEIQRRAKLSEAEMHLTFNNGLGLIIAVNANDVSAVRKQLPEAMEVGRIVKGRCDVRVV